MADRLPLWQVINLRQVVLRRASAETTLRPNALPEVGPRLVLDYDAKGIDVPGTNSIEVEARLRVLGESAEGAAPALKIEAVYLIIYERPADYVPSDAELNEFANVNGVFNAWPYWREFTHSIYHRMELPLPPLPVFRVGGGVHYDPPLKANA